eukprot:Hpha_TRINITY_DN15658_c1_g1::TRINITY_DN15658_c1_g1_i3::g.100451::m.100451
MKRKARRLCGEPIRAVVLFLLLRAAAGSATATFTTTFTLPSRSAYIYTTEYVCECDTYVYNTERLRNSDSYINPANSHHHRNKNAYIAECLHFYDTVIDFTVGHRHLDPIGDDPKRVGFWDMDTVTALCLRHGDQDVLSTYYNLHFDTDHDASVSESDLDRVCFIEERDRYSLCVAHDSFGKRHRKPIGLAAERKPDSDSVNNTPHDDPDAECFLHTPNCHADSASDPDTTHCHRQCDGQYHPTVLNGVQDPHLHNALCQSYFDSHRDIPQSHGVEHALGDCAFGQCNTHYFGVAAVTD